MKLEIRESQIEDIFATQLDEVRNALSIRDQISLISRQKILPSGNKIDLLFLSSTNLLLLELKAVKSEAVFCAQVAEYREELIELQQKEQIPNLSIKTFLVCTSFSEKHKILCRENEIIPIQFSPYELLKNYYFKVKAVTKLINIKPSNHGLWNLHLLNRIIYSVNAGATTSALHEKTGLSSSTIKSYIRLSTELGLTNRNKKISLTRLGKIYVNNRKKSSPMDYISDQQTDVLKEYIIKNPFSSPAIYGIYSVVETIFALSKNYYPVPLREAANYFGYLSGKKSEWDKKASGDAFVMYSNYGIDLGLLAKIGKEYYITPSGIKFMLLLELNKSLLFVDSL